MRTGRSTRVKWTSDQLQMAEMLIKQGSHSYDEMSKIINKNITSIQHLIKIHGWAYKPVRVKRGALFMDAQVKKADDSHMRHKDGRAVNYRGN